MGFNILRALPLPRPPPFPTYHPHTKAWVYGNYPRTKEWVWESLLEANSGALQICSEVIFKGEPACSCELCGFCSRSCDAFIKHLQSTQHREVAYKIEERKYVPLNPSNYEPVLFCNVCNYTGHYHRDMDMHYKSEEHSQKKRAIQTVAEPSVTREEVRPILTLKEEAPSVEEDAYLRPRRDWHTVFPEEVFVKRLERRERKRKEIRKEIQRKENSRKNSSEPSVTHEKDRPSVAHEKEGPSI
uniref:C2H2-type domain-containing protein n=2 Tax=Noccaea caerulescens TaxID=107243 RepID=A0A1J3DAN3_NOCCA